MYVSNREHVIYPAIREQLKWNLKWQPSQQIIDIPEQFLKSDEEMRLLFFWNLRIKIKEVLHCQCIVDKLCATENSDTRRHLCGGYNHHLKCKWEMKPWWNKVPKGWQVFKNVQNLHYIMMTMSPGQPNSIK